MSNQTKMFCLAIMLATAMEARAADWQLQSQAADRPLVLSYAVGEPVSYKFECGASDVIVTETGVTKMMDLKSGMAIGDDPSAVMPAGAAMMALFGGKGDPNFMPAEAVKNPRGGWDLTIRLAKDNKQIKAIGKSEMMSLFTTGYTMAVTMDAAARTKWNEFVQRCQATN